MMGKEATGLVLELHRRTTPLPHHSKHPALLPALSSPPHHSPPAPSWRARGEVRYEWVSFAYGAGKTALRDIFSCPARRR